MPVLKDPCTAESSGMARNLLLGIYRGSQLALGLWDPLNEQNLQSASEFCQRNGSRIEHWLDPDLKGAERGSIAYGTCVIIFFMLFSTFGLTAVLVDGRTETSKERDSRK
jgi:hypothetical protein